MSESGPEHDLSGVSREEVVERLGKIKHLGHGDPADLPSDHPEVVAANRVMEQWLELEGASRTVEAELEWSLSRTTVHVDAGFDDPGYLGEVADDWLWQDQDNARALGLVGVARKIQAKRREIRTLRRKLLAGEGDG